MITVPVPAHIDRYEVLGTLGRGATSTVYRVAEPGSDVEIALKLLDGTDSMGGSRERFAREFETLQRIHHPHIVTTLERGTWRGQLWYTMEIVEGPTLSKWVKEQGRLSAADGARLMLQAADAVAAAHRAGIVHRDIKPGNLVLFDDGARLKVLDFGLVKGVDASASLTAAGQVVGTPVWMAPERLQVAAAAHPTWDVYALGLVFYEAITGHNPFRGRNLVYTIRLVQAAQAPPPSRYIPTLPIPLDTLLLRCVARDPAQRPQSAAEVVDALRALG